MSTGAWIAIAAALAVLLVALVVGLTLYRRRQVSLTAQQTPQLETTEQKDRSGGYKAAGGFSFSQGATATAPPQPVERPAPTPPVIPEPPASPKPPVAPESTVIPEPKVVPLPAEVSEAPAPTVEPEQAPESGAVPTVEPAPRVEPVPGVEPLTAPAPSEVVPPVEEAAPVEEASPVEEAAPAPAAEPEVIAPPAVEPEVAPVPQVPPIEEIAPTEGRLDRLRGRLARSQSAVGKSLLGLLGGGDLDEDSWEEIEDTLLIADLGAATTTQIVERLRVQMAARSVRTEAEARAVLRDVLVEALHPELDRSIRALPHQDHPAVLLVVGVNGTGKTTTTGKLARVLVADGRRVLLGAADTFRAAAADQLQTWAERVGAEVVRGKEGADPAAIAFDAVARGTEQGVDAVLVDTAGRLHTKTGLMDELGKVKRVVEKKAAVDEVLLVLDATIGQNGLMQARVFAEVVDITGVVLTKLDGTAKGGIVFQVQHELGVPVKLVGLGEGADDLAPFEPGAFVDALLG